MIFNRTAAKITERPRDDIIGGEIDAALPFLTFPFREGRLRRTPGSGGETK